MNSWLEIKVKSLEEELENSKTDFENLEIVYKNSSCKCDTLVCENCENLEKKVHYLVKTVDKLYKGQSNFENVLASQNCVFGKAGLGFNPRPSKQPIVTCFYCMKRGHFVRFCKIRKYVVPRGFMKWIPKCNKDSIDQCKQNGPTFIRGPNLCT